MSDFSAHLDGDLLAQPAKGPCLMVLPGGAGDLARRKLLPALYNLARDRMLPERFALLATARTPRTDRQYRDLVASAVKQHSRRPPETDALERLLSRCHYQPADVAAAEGASVLAGRVEELDREHGTAGGRLFHLAMPPSAYGEAVRGLGGGGLFACACAGTDRSGPPCRIVVEKPFGSDRASAGELDRTLREYFDESRIYRLDHFLGKETVQNLLVFRFANAVFEPLLDRRYVHDVQITVAETDGVEGRGAFYDATGALRDMVQSHLLQLLCLVAMDRPEGLDGRSVSRRKVEILKAVRLVTVEEAAARSVRGQYAPGPGARGYRQEQGVAGDSQTETYVALALEIDTPRWSGVPFYLRTGKRLARKAGEIVVTFRPEAVRLFGPEACDWRSPNRLIFRLQPAEGIAIAFDAKAPGRRMLLRPVRMDFEYGRSFDAPSPEAYERLLLDALRGESSLFARAEEVEQSWAIADAVRAAWERTGQPALETYPTGSWGPDRANRIFTDTQTVWQTR